MDKLRIQGLIWHPDAVSLYVTFRGWTNVALFSLVITQFSRYGRMYLNKSNSRDTPSRKWQKLSGKVRIKPSFKSNQELFVSRSKSSATRWCRRRPVCLLATGHLRRQPIDDGNERNYTRSDNWRFGGWWPKHRSSVQQHVHVTWAYLHKHGVLVWCGHVFQFRIGYQLSCISRQRNWRPEFGFCLKWRPRRFRTHTNSGRWRDQKSRG